MPESGAGLEAEIVTALLAWLLLSGPGGPGSGDAGIAVDDGSVAGVFRADHRVQRRPS